MLHLLVTALHPERVFKVLNVLFVPWEQGPWKVDLFIGSVKHNEAAENNGRRH